MRGGILMRPKKSKPQNPNNPTNSSVFQAVLDLENAGVPTHILIPLKEYLKTYSATLRKADSLFRKHQYPQHTICWSRLYNDIGFEAFLTEKEYVILSFLAKGMWTNNLLQTSQNDILEYTCLSSKGNVNTAIHGLLEKGCIAIKFPGNNREKTVYMVNPEFATVGIEHKESLIKTFWDLVDDEKIEKEWHALRAYADPIYYFGRNSINGINFNETKKVHKEKKSD